MKTILRAALGALAILGLATGASQAAEKTIKMGTLSWEDLTPITGITKRVLEDAGYKVEVTTFSEWGIAYAALAKGDTQVMVSQIDYAANDFWKRNRNRLEKISPVSHGLRQGIAVPKYVPIDSIAQLNGEAAKFGNRIIGIEPGSGLMREASAAIPAYGLKLQLVEGGSAAMTAALKAAVDRKDWIAVTLWEPSWMAQKFDVKWLQDPKGAFAPAEGYYWIGQKGFSKDNPEARELMASIFIPVADITAINAAVNDGKPMDAAVQDWISAHAELIKRWKIVKSY